MNTITVFMALLSASQTYQLPSGLLAAVCWIESRHNPKAVHKDDGGEDSIGLCQLHFSTARGLGYKGTHKGLFSPKVNAHYAAKYLRWQLDRYEGNVEQAIAAYNAGSCRRNKKGQIKNRRYVEKILSTIRIYAQ